MKELGGKGRIGLWLIAHRNPFSRRPDGSFEFDGGFLLSVTPGSGWLFSFGIRAIGTLGFGWVSKAERAQAAERAVQAAEHQRLHDEGIDHGHGAEAGIPYHAPL